jgi:hypothetical protein
MRQHLPALPKRVGMPSPANFFALIRVNVRSNGFSLRARLNFETGSEALSQQLFNIHKEERGIDVRFFR